MPSADDREEVSTNEMMKNFMEEMMERQDRRFQELEERLAGAGAREGSASNSGGERDEGVDTGGSLPTHGEIEAIGGEFVENTRASTTSNIDPREFSSIKAAVPKFSGKSEDFPMWSKRFEAFVSMSGCLVSLVGGIEVAVGDSTKDTRYFLTQGVSHDHIKKARIAWVCLTESMSDTNLLDRIFATQSPSGGWRMLQDCFFPRSMADQVKWSDAFEAVRMEKGEEPMKFFSRVDKVVGILASLGVSKSEGDVNRKLVRTLTPDYEMEQRMVLYRENVSRAEIEAIVRQRYLNLPASKGKSVGQALFSNGAARGGRGGGPGGGRGQNRTRGRS